MLHLRSQSCTFPISDHTNDGPVRLSENHPFSDNKEVINQRLMIWTDFYTTCLNRTTRNRVCTDYLRRYSTLSNSGSLSHFITLIEFCEISYTDRHWVLVYTRSTRRRSVSRHNSRGNRGWWWNVVPGWMEWRHCEANSYIDKRGAILWAAVALDGWKVRIRFANRDQFDTFRNTLTEQGHSYSLLELTEPNETRVAVTDLTPQQRDTRPTTIRSRLVTTVWFQWVVRLNDTLYKKLQLQARKTYY